MMLAMIWILIADPLCDMFNISTAVRYVVFIAIGVDCGFIVNESMDN